MWQTAFADYRRLLMCTGNRGLLVWVVAGTNRIVGRPGRLADRPTGQPPVRRAGTSAEPLSGPGCTENRTGMTGLPRGGPEQGLRGAKAGLSFLKCFYILVPLTL